MRDAEAADSIAEAGGRRPGSGDATRDEADAAETPVASAPSSSAAGQAPPAQPTLAGAAATSQLPEPAQMSETLANLSAQIAQQVGQKTSRFDVQLTPDGMGRVDVAVQIDASGAVTASLSFEKADSAALVKDQSGALQTALASAGLSLAPESLKISHMQSDGSSALSAAALQTVASNTSSSGANAQFGGQNGGQNSAQNGGQPAQHTLAAGGQTFDPGGQSGGQPSRQDRPAGSTVAARSFQAAVSAADVVDRQTAYASSLSTRGLDIRI